MFSFFSKQKKNDYSECSGCGVCVMECPVWKNQHNVAMSPQGRSLAMQGGAAILDIAESIDGCLLCGACESVCPENIDLIGMTLSQRRTLNSLRDTSPSWYPDKNVPEFSNGNRPVNSTLLLPGKHLIKDENRLKRIKELLGGGIDISQKNSSADIAGLYEAGIPVDGPVFNIFVDSLQRYKVIIATDGILHRPLRNWLPKSKVIGLGEAILRKGEIQSKIDSDDIYIIESRSYHSEQKRLVKIYDKLRFVTNCQTNLDLQRMAVPTGASSILKNREIEEQQVNWILKGRNPKRIIVECMYDMELFSGVTDIPVVHISDLTLEPSLV